jgi:hypothetical protein
MTDLDTDQLRRALRASPEPEPTLDAAAIITRGRRLRWRRRAAAAGGGVCLAAAVFGAVAGVGRLTAPSPGPAQRTVVPAGPAGTRPLPAQSPRRGASASPSASNTAAPTTPATSSPTPTPTPSASAPARPVRSNSPVPTTSAGSATPSARPSVGDSQTSTPSASGAGASSDQPSPTSTAIR